MSSGARELGMSELSAEAIFGLSGKWSLPLRDK